MKHCPTLTFKIHKYSLAAEIVQSQLHPRCPSDLFKNPPLIVLSGFGTREEHLKLTTFIFQNIFPAIVINTVKLSSCQRIVLLNYDKETKLIDGTTLSDYSQWVFLAESGNLCKTIKCLI
ncbi:peter Pan-like protein [Solanum stenotomum]|uniref:peter Pan-like protein n=1 Tax=Solanum stenotomum TaxID=172797 RepID=UPI0020D15074|nr:peter Pan-like protein [Solanum stenotomum]